MPKFSYIKKIKISLAEYGEIVYVFRGDSPKYLREFSVLYHIKVDSKWKIIRRHCWVEHQKQFHTHVRIGLGRSKVKRIYPPLIKGTIVKALNWAKKDMNENWYKYLKKFEKLVKYNHDNKK